jgi:serine protease Do
MPRLLRYGAASVFAAAGLVLAAPPADGQVTAPAAAATADLSSVLEATTRAVTPAVVEIFTTTFAPGGAAARASDLITRQRGSGSGVIVDPEGYIVTNAHVVRGAQQLRVEVPVAPTGGSILAGRSRLVSGTIVGIDMETDLAVIKVEERGLPSVPFGDSDEVSAGQLVLAFGSPLGLQNSVSLGVVSAVARQLEPESPMIYIQTDASINPGSSGGPLVDVRGRLVGINTLIVTQAGGNEGLGFAAPSNIVRTVYEQIRKVGQVRRGDIGVRGQTMTPVLASGLGLKSDRGVILADVLPGTPAARAELRPGDLVLTLDGKPMENARQLQVNLYRRFVGDVVTLDVLRDGQVRKVPVVVAERYNPFTGAAAAPDPRESLVARLGILGVTLDKRIAEMLPVIRVQSGVVVASAAAGAIDAGEHELAPGDVIYAVNRTPVQDLARLRALLDGLPAGSPVVLHLERRGELMYVAFAVD